MQKVVFYLLVLILFIFQFCKNSQKEDTKKVIDSIDIKKTEANGLSIHDSLITYQGSWFWKSEDSSSSFKLVLVLKADSLNGKYCAAYDFGNRMDCDFDTTNFNLQQTFNQDSILMKFNSFYGGENGVAYIEKKGDSLLWKILEYPQGGDCFAPQYAVLHRKIEGW